MKNIEQYLEKYYEDKQNNFSGKWDERIEPIITEMFQRRQEVLNLSDEEQKNEIESFFEHVNYIEVVDEVATKKAVGLYNPIENKIQINTEMYKNWRNNSENGKQINSDQYLECFFHECSHAIAKESFLGSGVKSYIGSSRTGLEEAITERTSNMMTENPTQEDLENYIMQTDFYTNITFFPPALATAFCVDEKEMIQQARSGGIDAMNKYLLSNFSNDEKGQEYLKSLYSDLDVLHNAYSTKKSSAEVQEAMGNIIKNLKTVQSDRLSQNKANISDYDQYIENEKFNNNKLDTILENAIDLNKQFYNGNEQEQNNTATNMKEELEILGQNGKTKIDSMDIVNQNKDKFSNESFIDAMNEVSSNSFKSCIIDGKYNNILNNSFTTKYVKELSDIDFSAVGTNTEKYKVSSEIIQKHNEEMQNNWDNTKIVQDVEKVMDNPKDKSVNIFENTKEIAMVLSQTIDENTVEIRRAYVENTEKTTEMISEIWNSVTGNNKEQTAQETNTEHSYDAFRTGMHENDENVTKEPDNTKSERII